ncbi:NnrS family protein [Neisseria sp. Ec49-e6-T10]|uniref:NnrS family protein n=1 Tax=Neisseria sp. Ec49-e6-T10 TaxID=3140744 RepID=UPI003EBCA318
MKTSVLYQINTPKPNKRFALFELGFRPFFLFGALFSMIALTFWALLLNGSSEFTPHGNIIWWHAHEMLFGFTIAIVAGFLLTAVQNWTGIPSIKGHALTALVMLWLIPRILLLNDQWASFWMIMLLDLAFLPMVSFIMAHRVIKTKQWRNLPFSLVLFVLFLLNLMSYIGIVNDNFPLSLYAFEASVIAISLIVALIASRVVPFFTEKATNWQRKKSNPYLSIIANASLAFLIPLIFLNNGLLIQIVAAIAGTTLLCRWFSWGWQASFKNPLLWSLHFSYLCLPIGLLLIATNYPLSSALHCITVGTIGGMILSMMCRVSLGHTGRNLVTPKLMKYGFSLIIFGTLFRVIAQLTNHYLLLLDLSVLCWLLSFGLFIIHYTMILIQPRIDGKAG